MASRQVLLLAAAAVGVMVLLAPASAEVFMVGDAAGWTLKYPPTWADGKTFVVGDSLMFMYPAGEHTVVEVGGAGFMTCNVTGNQGIWNSGSDTIALSKSGRRWFVCGVSDHCAQGMKLVVTVVDVATPGPASPPESFRCC
ncbi:hypothetical protein ACQ4PT_007694 [Festuca glaucescens]